MPELFTWTEKSMYLLFTASINGKLQIGFKEVIFKYKKE